MTIPTVALRKMSTGSPLGSKDAYAEVFEYLKSITQTPRKPLTHTLIKQIMTAEPVHIAEYMVSEWQSVLCKYTLEVIEMARNQHNYNHLYIHDAYFNKYTYLNADSPENIVRTIDNGPPYYLDRVDRLEYLSLQFTFCVFCGRQSRARIAQFSNAISSMQFFDTENMVNQHELLLAFPLIKSYIRIAAACNDCNAPCTACGTRLNLTQFTLGDLFAYKDHMCVRCSTTGIIYLTPPKLSLSDIKQYHKRLIAFRKGESS